MHLVKTSEQLDLHNQKSEVFKKTRSVPASLPFKDQVTEQATVKWSIALHKTIYKTKEEKFKVSFMSHL